MKTIKIVALVTGAVYSSQSHGQEVEVNVIDALRITRTFFENSTCEGQTTGTMSYLVGHCEIEMSWPISNVFASRRISAQGEIVRFDTTDCSGEGRVSQDERLVFGLLSSAPISFGVCAQNGGDYYVDSIEPAGKGLVYTSIGAGDYTFYIQTPGDSCLTNLDQIYERELFVANDIMLFNECSRFPGRRWNKFMPVLLEDGSVRLNLYEDFDGFCTNVISTVLDLTAKNFCLHSEDRTQQIIFYPLRFEQYPPTRTIPPPFQTPLPDARFPVQTETVAFIQLFASNGNECQDIGSTHRFFSNTCVVRQAKNAVNGTLSEILDLTSKRVTTYVGGDCSGSIFDVEDLVDGEGECENEVSFQEVDYVQVYLSFRYRSGDSGRGPSWCSTSYKDAFESGHMVITARELIIGECQPFTSLGSFVRAEDRNGSAFILAFDSSECSGDGTDVTFSCTTYERGYAVYASSFVPFDDLPPEFVTESPTSESPTSESPTSESPTSESPTSESPTPSDSTALTYISFVIFTVVGSLLQ